MVLYPTIAVSDAFQSLLHFYAASLCPVPTASLGLFTVGVAGSVGVLRFGLDEGTYATANGALADVAGFVGLPLVGVAFAAPYSYMARECSIPALMYTLLFFEAATRSLAKWKRELVTVLINACLFIGPMVHRAVVEGDVMLGLGVGIFLLGSVVIGPDRHKVKMGMRCENWFHYCIGVAAVLIAKSVPV